MYTGLVSSGGQNYHHFFGRGHLTRRVLSTLFSQTQITSGSFDLSKSKYIHISIYKLLLILPTYQRVDETNTLQATHNLTDLGSVMESYDMKIAVENKGKVDIRLQFVGGKPEIVAVKRDEEKLLVADILCLHRYICPCKTCTKLSHDVILLTTAGNTT